MKSKKGKGIVMTLFTGGFVALFVGGIYVYTQNQIEPINAYEFARDIPVNTKIESSDLKKVSIPKSAISEKMALNKEEIVGKYNNTKVFNGEYVIKNNLVKKEEVDPFESIDLTKLRMVTIPADYEGALGGNIKRGDRIDLVYVGTTSKDGKTFTYSKTFMTDVLVYATTTDDGYKYVDRTESTGSTIEEESDINEGTQGGGDLAQITLAVTLNQSEELASRLKTGEIQIVGRFNDSQDYDTAGYISGDYTKIFSGTGNAETNK